MLRRLTRVHGYFALQNLLLESIYSRIELGGLCSVGVLSGSLMAFEVWKIISVVFVALC